MKKKASELTLGTHVKLLNHGYGTATVVKIRDGFVHLKRPYIHVDEATGIDYIGTEDLSFLINDTREFEIAIY